MILLDVNILVYAYVPDSPHHAVARTWLERRLGETARVGIPWNVLLGFLRVVSNARIVSTPASLPEAWKVIESWLERPNVWIPAPGDAHAKILAGVLRDASVSSHVMDADLAALAIEHGLNLCSADRGFSRYRGLRWENPLDPGD